MAQPQTMPQTVAKTVAPTQEKSIAREKTTRGDSLGTFLSPFVRWPIGRLFDDLWDGSWADSDRRLAPPLDVTEDGDEIVVSTEIPGVKKEDVTIQIENGTLSVSGEKSSETRQESAECRRRERRYGAFYRSVALPASVNTDQVSADLQDGVLRVHLPKRESAKAKVVRIR